MPRLGCGQAVSIDVAAGDVGMCDAARWVEPSMETELDEMRAELATLRLDMARLRQEIAALRQYIGEVPAMECGITTFEEWWNERRHE